MNDEVTHLCVIDGLLRLGLPGGMGCGVVRIDANDVNLVQIFEFGGIDPAQLATEDEMQQLFGWSCGHKQNPCCSFAMREKARTGLSRLAGLSAHEIDQRGVPLASRCNEDAVNR